MKTKYLKGFFDLSRKGGATGTEMVRTVKPDPEPTPGMVYVETCPLLSGMYGYLCCSGWVKPERLIPLRNIKENRERIRLWAAARRKGVEMSQMWYGVYKGARDGVTE